MKPLDFVKKYGEDAKKLEAENGISAVAVLTQAAVESGWGEKAPGYNFFGIKADSSWKGEIQTFATHEVIKGQRITVNASFRKYATPYDGFKDHSLFFFKNKRYAAALAVKSDPIAFIAEISKAGYATDPNYQKLLIQVAKEIQKLI